MHVCEILNQLTAPYYLERTSCNNPANVAKTKAAIRKAFQNQLDGKGFSLVEIVTSCPPTGVWSRWRRWTFWRTRCSRSSRWA